MTDDDTLADYWRDVKPHMQEASRRRREANRRTGRGRLEAATLLPGGTRRRRLVSRERIRKNSTNNTPLKSDRAFAILPLTAACCRISRGEAACIAMMSGSPTLESLPITASRKEPSTTGNAQESCREPFESACGQSARWALT